ncbi:MAG: hypothetical protein Q8N18_05695 [Opitutaceae bacterium]|nr:hypothetical protein [Opitutaceae bacterium]
MIIHRFATVLLAVVLPCAALFSGGCASIVHGGNRTITISTEPAGAKATVTKAGGDVVTVNRTPCTVSLDPKRGYFKGQAFVLKLELGGHKTVELQLQPAVSGWFFGNILFGGLIGMIAVDPVTGSMWNIEPDKIEQKLTAAQTATIDSRAGFTVVLASTLTAGERAAMTQIK